MSDQTKQDRNGTPGQVGQKPSGESGAGYGDQGGGMDSSGGTGSGSDSGGQAGQSGAGYGDHQQGDQSIQRSETIEAEDLEFEADDIDEDDE